MQGDEVFELIMKWVLFAITFTLFGALSVLVIVGANHLLGSSKISEQKTEAPRFAGDLKIFVDPETGCQYVRPINSSGAVSPRISPDGKSIMGCKEGRQ